MATFVVNIDIDNDAFQPDPGAELHRILFELSQKVRLHGPRDQYVMDSNGNRVGFTDVWGAPKSALS